MRITPRVYTSVLSFLASGNGVVWHMIIIRPVGKKSAPAKAGLAGAAAPPLVIKINVVCAMTSASTTLSHCRYLLEVERSDCLDLAQPAELPR